MTIRILRQLLLTAVPATLLSVTPALADVQMYPGQDVIVNLSAIPGMARPVLRLHAPRPHKPAVKKSAEAAAALPSETTPLPDTAPKPHKAKKMAEATAPQPAAPAPSSTPNAAIPFSFEPSAEAAKPAPPPPPAKAQQQASIAPTRKPTLDKSLTKQATVLFEASSFALSDNTTATLNDLGFSLKTALSSGSGRVEIIGFGGNPGDTSSTARRLSLERALAVRQALISEGVPADRIDVHAQGGVSDSGATDRVDIFVKG